MEDIPSDIILNWDDTGIYVVPGSQWTMEAKGSKKVEAVEAVKFSSNLHHVIKSRLCVTGSNHKIYFKLIY